MNTVDWSPTSEIMVHVSFPTTPAYVAKLERIDRAGIMRLRLNPNRLLWVSMSYAYPLGITRDMIDAFKTRHWDREHNYLQTDYLIMFNWFYRGYIIAKTGIKPTPAIDPVELIMQRLKYKIQQGQPERKSTKRQEAEELSLF